MFDAVSTSFRQWQCCNSRVISSTSMALYGQSLSEMSDSTWFECHLPVRFAFNRVGTGFWRSMAMRKLGCLQRKNAFMSLVTVGRTEMQVCGIFWGAKWAFAQDRHLGYFTGRGGDSLFSDPSILPPGGPRVCLSPAWLPFLVRWGKSLSAE